MRAIHIFPDEWKIPNNTMSLYDSINQGPFPTNILVKSYEGWNMVINVSGEPPFLKAVLMPSQLLTIVAFLPFTAQRDWAHLWSLNLSCVSFLIIARNTSLSQYIASRMGYTYHLFSRLDRAWFPKYTLTVCSSVILSFGKWRWSMI
jgi:hypothetical protein